MPKDVKGDQLALISAETAESHANLAENGRNAMQGIRDDDISHLEAAAVRAGRSVDVHSDTDWGQVAEYYKLRGRIGEELTASNMPNSVNLNDATGKTNFANYDIASPNEMASVKVKELTTEGEPRFGDYRKYYRDLTNPESRANQRAASDLLKLREGSPAHWRSLWGHLPTEVARASDKDALAQSLAGHATLRIPAEQVSMVRRNLSEDIQRSPAWYGFDAHVLPIDLRAVAESEVSRRIRPIDNYTTVEQMHTAAANLVNRRHGYSE